MEKDKRKPKIILSGGGTGGSVMPLLAVAEELMASYPAAHFFFFGTNSGPEKELVASFSKVPIEFRTLPGGKWRRYFSFQNFFDLFRIAAAFFRAIKELGEIKPDIVMSAGSFSSVPLVWAAALRKIPIVIHQQDVRPGLANRLMAPFARMVSVVFEKSLMDYGPKAVWTGNPISRSEVISARDVRKETREQYRLDPARPLLLAIGGGTGARAINELIAKTRERLASVCQVIHITGKGKSPETAIREDYQAFELLPHEEVLKLMALADLVVSRAGLGVLTDLSALDKAAIIIPMPASHQEDNAAWLAKETAAKVISQRELTPDIFVSQISSLLSDQAERGRLGQRLGKVIKKNAAENLAGLVEEILESRKDKKKDA